MEINKEFRGVSSWFNDWSAESEEAKFELQ